MYPCESQLFSSDVLFLSYVVEYAFFIHFTIAVILSLYKYASSSAIFDWFASNDFPL